MPIVEIELQNGTKKRVELSEGFTDADVEEVVSQLNNQTRDNQPTQQEQKRGIDLTPSGLVKQGLATVAAPIRGAIYGEDFKTARETGLNNLENFKPLGGLYDTAFDIGVYSKIPFLKNVGGASKAAQVGRFAGNAAIQGGTVGALESLKREGDLSGFGSGTGIAAGMQSVPVVGKLLSKPANYVGRKIVQGLTDLKPKTLEQVIKPNSQALDLTEDGAQNLLMNTTERIQKDYKNLLDNAGLDVQRAALNLPEERGVFASSLKNSLDDIYNGYSTSGQRELNPAFNNAGDIYDDITGLIDAGSDVQGVGKVSAKNLNDIMGNIKNYPLDWSKTSTKDRQTILKQIYGDFQRRLGNLSPELRKANAKYSKLARFDDNEGVRSIINPNVIKGENIDSASRALRNYNSTVTSGNKNRNIQDLENLFIKNGKEPFINDIDDVNAAMDLLTSVQNGRNFLGATTIAKGLTTPVLKGIRKLNRIGLPEKVARAKELLQVPAERLLNPLAVRMASPMLYGGVEYNDY